MVTDLDGFLVDFMRSSTELLQCPVGILPMGHYNVSTATRRDHLKARRTSTLVSTSI